MEEAERWRHRRAAGMLAVAVCSLGNRIPLHDEAMDFASIRKALELYEPED